MYAENYKTWMKETEEDTNKWNKIYANHISDKRLLSKINKELIKINSKDK